MMRKIFKKKQEWEKCYKRNVRLAKRGMERYREGWKRC